MDAEEGGQGEAALGAGAHSAEPVRTPARPANLLRLPRRKERIDLVGWAIVNDREGRVWTSPVAIGQLDEATAPEVGHALVAFSLGAEGQDGPALGAGPVEAVAAEGDLPVDGAGDLVVHRDEHAVQVVAARVGEVVGAVKADVGRVLGIGIVDQLGGGPVGKVVGARKADRADLDALFEPVDPDACEQLGRVAHQLDVSEVVAAVFVVTGRYAAVDRPVRQRLCDRSPIEAVGGCPSQHLAGDFGAGAGVVFLLLFGLDAPGRLIAGQLLVAVRIPPVHAAAHRLEARLGRGRGVLENSGGPFARVGD